MSGAARPRRRAGLALALALAALAFAALVTCGGTGDDGDDDDDDDDDDSTSDAGMLDAGVAYDAPPQLCQASLEVAPATPIAPADVVIGVALEGEFAGALSYEWQVFRYVDASAVAVEWMPRNRDGSQIQLRADEPGVYYVDVDVHDPDEECQGASTEINVGAGGALAQSYRLHLAPTAGAPPQDRVVTVPGGADYALGSLSLAGGVVVTGAVYDGRGAAVPGYLRFTPVGGGEPIERFAAADGQWSALVDPLASYQLLVVPAAGGLPPQTIAYSAQAAPVELVLDDGALVTGAVLDDSGDPVVGAVVAVRVAGTPSSLGITDGSGGFALRARPGGAVDVVVVPPEGSALPRLELTGATLALAQPLAIRFAASAPRDLAGTVLRDPAGAPLPGATFTALASLAVAGTVAAGAGEPIELTGAVRATAVAGPGGVLPSLAIPAAAYRAVVERAGAPASTATFDATAAAPASIATRAPVVVSGQLTGAGVAGAAVIVTPATGSDLAGAPSANAATTSDATGAFAVALAPQTSYELAVAPLSGSPVAPARIGLVTGGTALTLAPLPLMPGRRVSGRVTLPGVDGLAGVGIAVMCLDCAALAAAGVDPTRPIAFAISAGDGAFAVVVPDPGSAP